LILEVNEHTHISPSKSDNGDAGTNDLVDNELGNTLPEKTCNLEGYDLGCKVRSFALDYSHGLKTASLPHPVVHVGRALPRWQAPRRRLGSIPRWTRFAGQSACCAFMEDL
jgi:hypothetical protein